MLVSEEMVSLEDQKSWHEDELVEIFDAVIRDAELTGIQNLKFLNLYDIENSCTAGQVWEKLYLRVKSEISEKHRDTIEFILTHGSLSTRILKAVGGYFSEKNLHKIYSQLGECLAQNKLFTP